MSSFSRQMFLVYWAICPNMPSPRWVWWALGHVPNRTPPNPPISSSSMTPIFTHLTSHRGWLRWGTLFFCHLGLIQYCCSLFSLFRSSDLPVTRCVQSCMLVHLPQSCVCDTDYPCQNLKCLEKLPALLPGLSEFLRPVFSKVRPINNKFRPLF